MTVTPQKISRHVSVAVPLPLRIYLTYRLPESLPGSSAPGARAVVPVGRRLLTGIIVGDAEAPAPIDAQPAGTGRAIRLRDVVELPDAAPVIPPDLLTLALWASRYYAAPPGPMLAALIPPGTGRRSETLVSRSGELPADLSVADRDALAAIPTAGAISLKELALSPAIVRRMRERGLIRVETVLKSARVSEKFTHAARPLYATLEQALALCARAPRQQAVLKLMAQAPEGHLLTLEEIHDRLGPSGPAVKSLAGKGLVRLERRQVRREPPHLAARGPAARVDPTPDQAAALSEIGGALDAGEGRAFLLMGVTGSGKTEVYLRAIEKCLALGRDAIYLVPEITLTPLLARDLRARLGSSLAILHSSLSPGERFDEWRRARSGAARVVLGARSAVLAPLPRTGLIVVDEEQDGSYKQEEDPRYNARDLALVRGRESGAVVILGSATPAVDTYHAAANGKYGLLRLSSRIHDRPMAEVRIVDMREEFARTGRDDLISEPMRDAVTGKLARGEQAIILLNRRGYAPYVLCRSCGANEQCRRCSLALIFHRAENRLSCHFCGYTRGLPKTCSTCRSAKIALMGSGTERLEEKLREIFPEARIARLDRDTARGRRAPAEILEAFEKGEFNLLVGTQMVAKGHDFPGVTIVGVLGADNALAFPDFRAAERTFQLLTQVAGRSGRGREPGQVVVQAFHRDHYALETAALQDYQAFYEKEIRFRRIMKYPPFVAIANIVVLAGSPESGVQRARTVGEVFRAVGGDRLQVIGPTVAPVAKLKDRYRYQVLLKSDSKRRLSDALNHAVMELTTRGISSARDLVIDMDPVTLM